MEKGFLFDTVQDSSGLADFLAQVGAVQRGKPGRFVIKVNWYAPLPGYYTSARTLDMLLQALPGEKLIVEGYSHARNDGSRRVFARQVDANRSWIQEQDRWFLAHTGLQEVLERHKARYLSVTEAVWSGRTVPPQQVREACGSAIREGDGALKHQEFFSCLPSELWAWRDATFINFAKVKLPGEDSRPWSPPLKNLFGLIPDPDRTAYHDDLPQSILEINRVYRALFRVVDVAEAIDSMLVYRSTGRHQVRWGAYDVLEGLGLVASDPNPVELDLACAALFGFDLRQRTLVRSATEFFGFWDDGLLRTLRQESPFLRRKGI